MKNSIDFSSLFANGSFPELQIIKETVGEMLSKENSDEKEIMKDIISFLISQCSDKHHSASFKCGKVIGENVFELEKFKEWGSLAHIAKDVKESSIKAFEEDIKGKEHKEMFSGILSLFKLQSRVMNSSIPDVKEMFREEWLQKNYPDLYKK